jgi:hypothetical protein
MSHANALFTKGYTSPLSEDVKLRVLKRLSQALFVKLGKSCQLLRQEWDALQLARSVLPPHEVMILEACGLEHLKEFKESVIYEHRASPKGGFYKGCWIPVNDDPSQYDYEVDVADVFPFVIPYATQFKEVEVKLHAVMCKTQAMGDSRTYDEALGWFEVVLECINTLPLFPRFSNPLYLAGFDPESRT